MDMKKFTWFALFGSIAFVAACGGGSSTPDAHIVHMVDAPALPDAGPTPDAASAIDGAPAFKCDTVNQDCTDAVKTKCTLTSNSMNVLSETCLAPTGMVASKATCLRTPSVGFAGVGHDDCDKGLFCSGRGEPVDMMGNPTMRACRLFCRASSACGTGEKCFTIGSFTPADGFCVPSCTLWGMAAQCPSGLACGFSEDQEGDLNGVCETTDPAGTQGFDCSMTGLCAANFICISNGTTTQCDAACDTAGGAAGMHPCTAGTCSPFTGAPTGFGICM